MGRMTPKYIRVINQNCEYMYISTVKKSIKKNQQYVHSYKNHLHKKIKKKQYNVSMACIVI